MIKRVGGVVAAAARRAGFDELPELTIEPGRSLVAPTAVALYRVGSVKQIPEGRTYVAVDGGMADNIRPTAYGAKYSAVIANRADDRGAQVDVAIAGKYCETGDILIQHVDLPLPNIGDLVAIPTAGAYHLSMASNYNMALRPAVVVVSNGRARIVRRRETYEDLLAAEVMAERVKA
jgi:diaminopimelate decarboxylase